MTNNAWGAEEELLRNAMDLESPRAALRCRIVQAAGRARERQSMQRNVMRGVSACVLFCGVFFAVSLGQEMPATLATRTVHSRPSSAAPRTAFFDLPSQLDGLLPDLPGDDWERVEQAEEWRASRASALRSTL